MFEWLHHDRMFQVWLYTVSHRQLLLRSTKGSEADSRIDVLFKNVGAMKIVPVLQDLEIRECTAEAVGVEELASATQDRTVYAIRAREFEGWVIAGSIFVHEDDGDYDQPSALLPSS